MKKLIMILSCFVLAGAQLLFAQTMTISGKATGKEDGAPIPGVSVLVKGTTIGTITNNEGKYTLSVPQTATSLTFSFIGMKSVEVPIEKRTSIDVVLEGEILNLNEVVVTALGIKRSEKSLGYSVSKVNGDESVQKSEPDILRSLGGKVPGLDIKVSEGAPGAGTKVTLRGNSTFYGSNQPIIIVDGIPLENEEISTTSQVSGNGGAYQSGLSTIDPNDIASMSVLKGMAAAALYGSRAANGAIVITTKSGSSADSKKGLKVVFGSSYSWETVANLPVYQNSYGNGANFIYSNANGSWGPKFGSQDSIPVWPAYGAAFPKMFPTGKVPYVAQPDNVKNLFKTGTIKENSLSVSGGNDVFTYNTTASLSNQNGYIPNSKFDRYNFGVGGSVKISPKFRTTANLSYARTENVSGFYGENQFNDAASSFARVLLLGRTWNMNLPYEDPANGFPLSTNPSQYDNPLWSWQHNRILTTTERILAGANLDYELAKGLDLIYKFGLNQYSLGRNQITDIGSRSAGGQGRIINENYNRQELESNLMLSYDKTFNDIYSFRAILGYNVNQNSSNDHIVTGQKFTVPGIYDLTNTQGTVVSKNSPFSERRLYGLYGDITLGYKDYLFLNYSARNDHSSTLPTNANSYFYQSIAGSFLFSDALHMQSDLFTFGKIRISLANTGNDAPPYSLYKTFALTNTFLTLPTMTTPSQGPNPNLKNESVSEFEVGTQLNFVQNRIGLDFTYYDKTSKDLLTGITLPSSSGYTSQIANVGEMTNKGIEIGLNLVPIKLESGFNWSIYTVYTRNRNKVTKIAPGVDQIIYSDLGLTGINPYIKVGQPLGVFQGTVPVKDKNGDLVIDPATGFPFVAPDIAIIGDPNPDYKMGITNTFKFKGFTMSFLIDFTKGGDVYSTSINSLLGRGVTKDTEDREHGWIIPGVYGKIDGTVYKDASGNPIQNATSVSTNELYFSGGGTETSFGLNCAGYYNVFDGTVYRLREFTFGYDIPRSLTQKIKIDGINISFTARNLWYYAPNVPKYTNFDPEVSSLGASSNIQGIELACAPTPRRFGINLRVTF